MRASGGTSYIALRPLLADYTVSMSRGATVVYPKDAAQIVGLADIFPGARVLEAGAGSGALSCWLLRAIGEDGLLCLLRAQGRLRRDRAGATSKATSAARTQAWRLIVGGLPRDDDQAAEPAQAPAGDWPADAQPPATGDFDRVVLDLLAPWEHVRWCG